MVQKLAAFFVRKCQNRKNKFQQQLPYFPANMRPYRTRDPYTFRQTFWKEVTVLQNITVFPCMRDTLISKANKNGQIGVSYTWENMVFRYL